jgi:hypothetical protein
MPCCPLEVAAAVSHALVRTSAICSGILASTLSEDSVSAIKYSLLLLVRTTQHVHSKTTVVALQLLLTASTTAA